MHQRVKTSLLLFASALILAACEGTTGSVKEDTTTQEQTASASGATGTTQGVTSGSGWAGDPLDDPNSLLSKRVIYFDFDDSTILEENKAILEAHAKYLANNPGATVTLEGHADERGTREYNMGLGDQRAVSVRQFVTLIGASGQQVRTVSYGEERPAAIGHDEESWALNRRVEIIYRTR